MINKKNDQQQQQKELLSSAQQSFRKVIEWFKDDDKERTVVALSGGVDSAVIALAAKKAFGVNALAITANYNTLSNEELAAAKKIATEIGIAHKILEYNELENPDFVKNDELRCYHCRNELGQRVAKEAQKRGIKLVVDGTNVDDLKEYRPGIAALRKNGVRSPFVELEIDKAQIRAVALEFGLSIYDKPSNACLASRIPTGTEIRYEKLKRIEKSEIIVKKLSNVRQVRVRDHGDIARIEVERLELNKLFNVDVLEKIDAQLRDLGFRYVTIDIRGYRSGNLVVID